MIPILWERAAGVRPSRKVYAQKEAKRVVPQLEVELLGLQERLESGSHTTSLLQLDIHSVHKVLHNEGANTDLSCTGECGPSCE